MNRLKMLSAAALMIAIGCQGNEAKPDNNALAAQTKKQETPASTEATPAEKPEEKPEEKPAAENPDVGGPPVVMLLEAGAEPRQTLRLKLAKGTKATSVMTTKMGVEMQIGPSVVPAKNIPATKMTMNIDIVEVSPEGDVSYAFKFDDAQVVDEPGVPPALVEGMRSLLSGMNGLSGKGTVTDRGFNKGAQFDIPADMNPQLQQTLNGMRQSLNQLAAPLPEEPVGVGAKWKVEQLITQNGLTLKQSATFELKEINGDKLVVAVSVEQSADPQEFSPPGMPPGAKARLNSLSSKGSGELNLDLTQVLPTTSTISLRSDMQMQATMGPQTQDIGMKMTMDISIAPK